VTAVVGPNGSGKSNIAEAVRWALGEQNARVMRCDRKMEEVIFHGSEKRGALGFAEVALTIDNTDRTLSWDADEVTLTRRLYRSGESEYFINKSAVRLKDITLLLMDTGLGAGGYSIIAQGMIDRIMTEKPADRRGVFEEAAGIAKYRSRKEEAQRKLNAAEQNLLRVSDKIDELEPQVEALRDQAETARRFLLLRDELRGHEINLWLHQIEGIRAGKDKQNDAFRAAKERFEQSRAELDGMYADMERMERESLDLAQASEVLRKTVSDTESRRAEAEGSLKVAQNDVNHLERAKAELLDAAERHDERLAALQRQRAEREASFLAVEESLRAENGALAALTEEIAVLAAQSGDLTAKADALRARVAAEQAAISEGKLTITALEARRGELAARRQALIAEQERGGAALTEAKHRMEIVARDLAAAREKAGELDNVIQGYTMRVVQREGKFAEAREKREALRRRREEKGSRLNLLRDLEHEYEGNHAVATVMGSRLPGLHGVLSDLIQTGDETALAVEIALGAALQNIVVGSENDAKAAIGLLKERRAGRATFLPLTTVDGREWTDAPTGGESLGLASQLVNCDEQYRGIVRSLLGRTLVCRTLDGAIELSRELGQRIRIVTLDGQVINAGGAITGGSVGKKVGILSRKNEIARLEGELSVLAEQESDAQKRFEETERALKAARYDLDVAEGERTQAKDEGNALAAEERHRTALLKTLEDAGAMSAAELENLGQSLTAIGGETETANSRVGDHTAASARLEEELASLTEGVSTLGLTRGSVLERQASLRERIAGLQAERDSTLAALADYDERIRDLSMDAGSRAAALADYERRAELLRKRCEETGAEIGELSLELANRRAEAEVLAAKQRTLEGERVLTNRRVKDGAEQNMALSRAADKLENNLQTTQKEEDAIISRLWEQYELTVTKAQESRTPMESVSRAQRRAGELKKEIAALGSVNVGAIEAYESVGERYRYLTEQKGDAVRSKNELDGIIERITGEMRNQFAERFALIAKKFSETFTEIFGGGEAALELDEGADILESGVEVKAQPPGKKLRSISLLSGGEQSLSAIALYFAIFKVRPAPFCVLDEIDHDLDDVNVGRFASYLRRLSQNTQYLVVTHRRGTMEQVGMLYGVTAQEPGVSKVIPLRLDQIEDAD
jgi:chromosome segregation protein